jgi:hypothetical protein
LSPSPFPAEGLGVQTYVIPENGRFAVYLDVALQRPGATPSEPPFEVVRHRIADYPTAEAAETAARWMGRGAARDLPAPPSGH